jgi:DNA-binding NtrC family response regulator
MSDTESKIRDTQAASELRPDGQDQSGIVRSNPSPADPVNFSLRVLRAEAESHAISHALQHTGGNRKRAAQLLRISYRGLLYKMQRFNITPAGAGCRVVPVSGKEAKIDDFSGA